jgi:UDP-N-acetylmuramoyl-tripeptide--D-alanyl-D-alanine ligase
MVRAVLAFDADSHTGPMRRVRASAIADAVGGALLGPDPWVERVVIDSREATRGCLFVALPGERTDGHRFVHDALGRGAAAAVVRRGAASSGRLILVDDPAEALLALGAHERAALACRVVGITGSVGKTSAKDFTAGVVGCMFRVAASPRSFNNEIGLPLTILAAAPDTQVLVAELGAGAVGEIARLCEVVRPDIGVVTRIGPGHLETFGSLEAIANAKAELVEALTGEGVAVLNADDQVVASFHGRTRATALRFGRTPEADVRAETVRVDTSGRARFTVVHDGRRAPVRLRPIGEHMVTSALAAIACGVVLGVDLAVSADRVATVEPASGRMRECAAPDGIRVLDDSYNANPVSMLAALKATTAARGRRRRAIAVLGPMAQLGAAERDEHERVGRSLAELGLDALVAVGERARGIADGALSAGMPRARVRWCLDVDEAVDVVRNSAASGDVVLVKASRVERFERIVEELCTW